MWALLLVLSAAGDFPRFEPQEIATDLTIGYAVLVADINGDGRPDIVVVDKHRVLWYENPTWKPRLILQGKTAPDNVCAAVADLDGDGKLDLVLGAGWKATDTRTPGTLQCLRRGKTLDDEWTLFPIPCDEPTVHRVHVVDDFYGDGKRHLFVAPLQGRDCTAKGGWTDGRPVKILAYPIPADPTKPENWKAGPVGDKFPLGGGEFYVVHNIRPYRGRQTELMPDFGDQWELMVASAQGPSYLTAGRGRSAGQTFNGSVHYRKPSVAGAASEITAGRVAGSRVWATIEPWHGGQVVTYTLPAKGPDFCDRHVIDDTLRWGHALHFADLDGDGTPELVAGVRDDPAKGDAFTERRGIRVYRCTDGKGAKWDRLLVDPGGVAVEDLAVADLDGDGRPDIVAVGRQTKNVKVYWNRKP